MHQVLGVDAATVLYFVAGALGTAGRVWLSPTLPNLGARLVIESVSGGAGGILLPGLGAAIFPAAALTLPPIYKAALILLMTGSSSFAIGEILARFGVGTSEEKK